MYPAHISTHCRSTVSVGGFRGSLLQSPSASLVSPRREGASWSPAWLEVVIFPRRRSLPRARLDLGRVLMEAQCLTRFRSARQCLGLRQRSCPRPPRLAWSPPLYRSLVLLVQRRELAELVRRPQLASVNRHWRNWAVVRPCGRPIDGRQLPDKWAIVQSAGGRMSVSVRIS